tara:strand:+ start:245 stop:496 length:252 start_codon:yes stop_codon:yes gene_type:complete
MEPDNTPEEDPPVGLLPLPETEAVRGIQVTLDKIEDPLPGLEPTPGRQNETSSLQSELAALREVVRTMPETIAKAVEEAMEVG